MDSADTNSHKDNSSQASKSQDNSEKPSLATPRSATEKRYMAILKYVLGGLLTWGVVGWIGSIIFGQKWILYVGLGLGLVGGVYLAYKHNLFSGHSSQDE